MTVQTYSAKDVEVTWLGVDLSKGWAEDTFLTVEPNGPIMTTTFGADGQMAPSFASDRGATITMTFQQTASANIELARLVAASDAKIKNGGLNISPFRVVDKVGGSAAFTAINAIMTEIPTTNFANSAGEKTWVWVCEELIVEDPFIIALRAIPTEGGFV